MYHSCDMRNSNKILVRKPERNIPLGRQDVDRKVLRKRSERLLTGFTWLRLGTGGGLLRTL
jgi:hypothetical protein